MILIFFLFLLREHNKTENLIYFILNNNIRKEKYVSDSNKENCIFHQHTVSLSIKLREDNAYI